MQWYSFALPTLLTIMASGPVRADTQVQSSRPAAPPTADVRGVPDTGAVTRPKVADRPAEPIADQAVEQGFDDWITSFRDRAAAKGIATATLNGAFDGVRYDPDIIKRDRNQSEFTKTIWDYLDSAASDTRVANGKAALAAHGATLNAIEKRYGVDRHVVAAVWGLESAYGTFRGSQDVVQSLATLAYDGRRGAFFEAQLIAALEILQNGDTAPRNMTGSWAGAMGHTQFIPTSYLSFAVDFTGDGKRDIWSDDPADALASTAAYLAKSGWVTGQPWGVEVQIPDGFDYTQANRNIVKQPSTWAAMGVAPVAGAFDDAHGDASVLLPAGHQGAAFLIFKNFSVIERYNTADAYVIGVGHLSDRIRGGAAIQADWPRDDRALTFSERTELQRNLTGLGYDTKGIDGKIGPNTINAVRAFQLAKGMPADGYAPPALLQRLR